MDFEPLSLHRERFAPDQPTPLSIYDTGGRLLLAKGHRFDQLGQLDKLIDRDARVDPRELGDPSDDIARARADQLPAYWDAQVNAMARLLRTTPAGDFTHTLDRASRPLLALIERDPDLAILQTVRTEAEQGGTSSYASRHAVHTATAACLAATRLGWGLAQKQCAVRAALTMNLAMADLQNRLVTQVSPVTPLQRAEIHSHPERSAALLEMAGVTDRDWLDAVRQHHEEDGGTGYPCRPAKVHEVAQLLHSADTFTAKLSPRLRRAPLLADAAARLQFQAGRGDVMTAALIKEFGLYPPGCAVRLKSGEVGLVMRRGDTASTPRVAVLSDRSGQGLPEPAQRDTARAEFGIAAVIPWAGLKLRVGLEKLMQAVPEPH
ncbi:HD-GYP domain-containing protein [Roseateles sp. BYS87W]|uniref:HD-GYP domain-containing protein n=1 Tax=Pelomonas baiyunensis TaxID=3299026 RepID=A0ABW7H566_9BURK